MPINPVTRERAMKRLDYPSTGIHHLDWHAAYQTDVSQLLDALAEAERHADPTTEGWRLEALRLRDFCTEVEAERRELRARIAQDDEERQHMTSVRETLERDLSSQRATIAYQTGMLSWVAERLGSRCIEDIRTDLPEALHARDEAVRERDIALVERDEARRQSDRDAREDISAISRFFSGGEADNVVSAVRDTIDARNDAVANCRRLETDLNRIRNLNRVQGDTLRRIGETLGVQVITLESVQAAAQGFSDRVAELDGRFNRLTAKLQDAEIEQERLRGVILSKDEAITKLAAARDEYRIAFRAISVEKAEAINSLRTTEQRAAAAEEAIRLISKERDVLSVEAEQADTYKLMADRLGDFVKDVAKALHAEPGTEILGTAKALHAELERLRANRGRLNDATAELDVDDEVFGRLAVLLDCHAGAEVIIEAVRDLGIAHRKALQDVSDRDRWLEACGQTAEGLRQKLAKVREAAQLD
jgi:hypothetical protein